MMKITLEEIAESLKLMGDDAARDRINLFRKEELISDFVYLKLLHLINGGDPEIIKSWKLGSEVLEAKQSLSIWARLKNWAKCER